MFRVVFCVIIWNSAAFFELLYNAVFGILEAGFLSCSFDRGLCDWIQHKEGDVHWEAVPDSLGNCFPISESAFYIIKNSLRQVKYIN